MTTDEINQYFDELNDELCAIDVKGEICLYGGAVMCLAFNARPATKDVDAVFEPVSHIRKAAGRIAEKHGLRKDWLNYAVKMFLVPHERRILLDKSHLKIYVPSTDYLLAMKTLSARANTFDRSDIEILIRELSIREIEKVLDIVGHYYPNKEVKEATRLLLEEILSSQS